MDNSQNGYNSVERTGKIEKTIFFQPENLDVKMACLHLSDSWEKMSGIIIMMNKRGQNHKLERSQENEKKYVCGPSIEALTSSF